MQAVFFDPSREPADALAHEDEEAGRHLVRHDAETLWCVGQQPSQRMISFSCTNFATYPPKF